LAREDAIFPNALVPAFNTAFPLTETFSASFASKLLPATSFEVTRLTVLTVSVVPAGIVTAFKDVAATQAQITAITEILFVSFIIISLVGG
jgi:hypothetical protein